MIFSVGDLLQTKPSAERLQKIVPILRAGEETTNTTDMGNYR